MSPSLSWIERSDLEQALARPEAQAKPTPASDWAKPRAPSREGSAVAPEPRRTFGAEPEPPVPTLEGSVSQRAQRFAEWMREAFGCEAVCLADADGLIIHARGAGDRDAAASAALANALRPLTSWLGGAAVSATIESEGGRLLQVVWVQARLGAHAAVVAAPTPLGVEQLRRVRAVLVRVFE